MLFIVNINVCYLVLVIYGLEQIVKWFASETTHFPNCKRSRTYEYYICLPPPTPVIEFLADLNRKPPIHTYIKI